MIAQFTALEGDQEETNRFMGTIAGTVPVPEFFEEENIRRITEKAGLMAPMAA
jgi:hypothetical protein